MWKRKKKFKFRDSGLGKPCSDAGLFLRPKIGNRQKVGLMHDHNQHCPGA